MISLCIVSAQKSTFIFFAILRRFWTGNQRRNTGVRHAELCIYPSRKLSTVFIFYRIKNLDKTAVNTRRVKVETPYHPALR